VAARARRRQPPPAACCSARALALLVGIPTGCDAAAMRAALRCCLAMPGAAAAAAAARCGRSTAMRDAATQQRNKLLWSGESQFFK
jgi:hypothetical protein